MSGVFLSYSRADREAARQVVAGLRALGAEVWWDEDMPGVDWQLELERQITALAGVIVLWTPVSRNSKNVRAEAGLAQQYDKLINAMAGLPAPPFPFNGVNGLPLDGWTGRASHHGWARLVQTVDSCLVGVGAIKAGQLVTALQQRDALIREKARDAAAAEAAYQEAKTAEDETAESLAAARASLTAVETILERVVELRASGPVLRAAQDDVDKARDRVAQAEQQRRDAAATLAPAARGLTRARAAFDQLFDDPEGAGPAPAAPFAPPFVLGAGDAPDEPGQAPTAVAPTSSPAPPPEAPPAAVPPVVPAIADAPAQAAAAAPEAAPAASPPPPPEPAGPTPAPAATAAPSRSARGLNPIIVGAAVAGVLALGVGAWIVMRHGAAPATNLAEASQPASADNAAVAPATAGAPVAGADPIVGVWRVSRWANAGIRYYGELTISPDASGQLSGALRVNYMLKRQLVEATETFAISHGDRYELRGGDAKVVSGQAVYGADNLSCTLAGAELDCYVLTDPTVQVVFVRG